jgi:hypothetical protein
LAVVKHHLPLIRSGLAAAEREGPDLLKKVGVPPGATVFSPVTMKRTEEDSESMWAGEPTGVSWTAFWDAPGNHAAVDAWYADHLLTDGWKVFQDPVPSTVQIQFWKDKWLLTIGHAASFEKEHPPHVRIRMELEWGYFHKLDIANRSWLPSF